MATTGESSDTVSETGEIPGHGRYVFTAAVDEAPIVGRAECECGHSAFIGADELLMPWWRAHRADPPAPAAILATRLGIR